jgi:hypothetical protein
LLRSEKSEINPVDIPLKYLLETSRNILGEYQLSRLDKAAQLKREIREKREQLDDLMVQAAFALWLRENREEILRLCSSVEAVRDPKTG